MKKIEIISALGAAALMAAAFGGCSHNKAKEDQSAEQVRAEQTQTQPQSQPSSTDTASTAASTTATDTSSSQTEQGGKSSASTASTSQSSDQWSQLQGAALQNQMLNAMVLTKLHHMNQKEMQMTQWATDKAQSQSVKSAIQQLVSDHTELDSRVTTVAQQKNIQLPGFQAADYEQAMMDNLQGLNGQQFDMAWTNAMKSGHKLALQELNWFSTQVKDPQVKQLVKTTAAKVSAHAKMISTMSRGLASQPASSSSTDSMSSTKSNDSSMDQQPSTERGGMSEDSSDMNNANPSVDQVPSHENEQ